MEFVLNFYDVFFIWIYKLKSPETIGIGTASFVRCEDGFKNLIMKLITHQYLHMLRFSL